MGDTGSKVEAQRNVHMILRVNGEDVEVSFAPYKTLLEVLREDLDLTGTKHGCELGECGACAVLVDGAAAVLPQARARVRRRGSKPSKGLAAARNCIRCRRRSPITAARSAATARRAS